MDDCKFCQLYKVKAVGIEELSTIKHFFFYWDIHPVTPGHLLIISKRHCQRFVDLTEGENAELIDAIKRAYKLIEHSNLAEVYKLLAVAHTTTKAQAYIQQATNQVKVLRGKPDAYNQGLNDGRAAGQTIEHFHYHIMPRWHGDMDDPTGGIRHMFPDKGDYTK